MAASGLRPAIFPTAAPRRSARTVSQFQCMVILSGPARIVALVSRYHQQAFQSHPSTFDGKRPEGPLALRRYAALATVSSSYPSIRQRFQTLPPVRHCQRSSKPLPVTVRLACVRPAASVHLP